MASTCVATSLKFCWLPAGHLLLHQGQEEMEEEQPVQTVRYVIERKARKATGVWLLVA